MGCVEPGSCKWGKVANRDTLDELYQNHYYGSAYMRESHILVCDIEDVSTRAVAVMVLCILGSLESHNRS